MTGGEVDVERIGDMENPSSAVPSLPEAVGAGGGDGGSRLVGRQAGEVRHVTAEAGGAPGEAVADEVATKQGLVDEQHRLERARAVHVEHQAAVPGVRHLDLVHGTSQASEVGRRAR